MKFSSNVGEVIISADFINLLRRPVDHCYGLEATRIPWNAPAAALAHKFNVYLYDVSR